MTSTNTTIEARHDRRIEADATGFTVTCTASNKTLVVALNSDECQRMAAALAPDLGPARPITREEQGQLWAAIRDELRGVYPSATDHDHRKLDLAASAAADAVVEYLNARRPKPDDVGSVDAEAAIALAVAEDHAARWRRAHSIVEVERDQARAERDKAREQAGTLVHDLEWLQRRLGEQGDSLDRAERLARQYMDRAEDAERDRDEWKARAEQAEARTAPAVTRADVEKVVADWVDDAPELVNDLWSLLSGDDPAVYVVRESDIAAVEVERRTDGGWQASSPSLMSGWGAEPYVEMDVDRYKAELLNALAVQRAIEAEAQSPDPEPEGDVIVRDAHDRMWWVTDDGWTNGTSRLDHDWSEVPKPIRVVYRAEGGEQS